MSLGAGVINLLEDKKRARVQISKELIMRLGLLSIMLGLYDQPLNYTQGGRKVARKSNFSTEIFRRESRYFEGNLGRA